MPKRQNVADKGFLGRKDDITTGTHQREERVEGNNLFVWAWRTTLSHVLAEIRIVSGESFVFVLKQDPVIDLLRIKKKF